MSVRTISIRDYLAFVSACYQNDAWFKDNKSALIKMLTHPKSAFYQNSRQQVVGLFRNHSLRAECIFITHRYDPDNLMMAFFESLDNDPILLKELIDYAKDLATAWNCNRLIAGIDGHIAYSVGYIEDAAHDFPVFGQSYNPPFYGSLFEPFGFAKTRLITFKNRISAIPQAMMRKYGMKSDVRFVYGDLSTRKTFKETVKRYVDMNEACFAHHKFFYRRPFEEEMELFCSMRPLLRPENFIFAYVNNVLSGFLFWYHDFNELVQPKGEANWKTYLKYKVLNWYPVTAKIEEIAVMPEYRNTALYVLLLMELYRLAAEKYPITTQVVSGWIFEDNTRSKRLTERGLQEPYKKFSVYELSLSSF